jgi:hypothetical protein
MTVESYEERRKREKQADLAAKYRQIGSGAILAALACKMREDDETKKSKDTRAA